MNITFVTSNENIDFSQVRELLTGVVLARADWSVEKVKDAFINSSFVVYAFDGDLLVGLARVLSDGFEWTLLSDLAVQKAYQKQGVGKAVLDVVLEHYKGHEIFAYSYLEAMDFFEEAGFKRSKNAFTYSGLDDEALDASIPKDEFFLPIGYKYETEFYEFAGNFPVGQKSTLNRDNLSIRYTVSNDDTDYEQVNKILEASFGGHDRDINVTKGAFERSQYFSYAYDQDKLIGCARAVSDGVSQGFILNVAVDPTYQGLHLGWNVVCNLAKQMPGQNIFLNTHPGGVGFYNRPGFRRNKTAFMYQKNQDMPQEIAKGFALPKGYRFADEF